jgi:anhydro-N-acetylmuramic acid kinase
MRLKPMIVAGVMSGTSADGVDVALVQIAPGARSPKISLIAHETFPYPARLRRAVLGAMNAESTSTAELARLHWRLGMSYAEAVLETSKRHKVKLELVGCHGQTLYHQANSEPYLGRKFSCTWQLGEAAVIAADVGVPVVSNFRSADMVAGGQGAPLVPLLDFVLFADMKRGRVLQNIGGIANLTAIPPGADAKKLIAFDTGPGNMVIDALAQALWNQKYDHNGTIASRGSVIQPVLKTCLASPYFKRRPPRTTGREQFGREYATRFAKQCRAYSKRNEDAMATATALTAESIARSYAQFVHPKMTGAIVDYVVSGGGARNAALMKMLADRLEPMGPTLSSSDAYGMPAAAKEATAFALLAWMTWNQLPGNIVAATGAKQPVILGQVTYAS